ncbi:MAG: PAS domain-containing protein [Bacteroidota bacterium]|nr:PAS domain-containing protein [Bacteroidota bacterium]
MMPQSKNQNQKIKDLIELNDELENYFRNTIIPQLFVDANLILRKFTPPAMKQFDLKTEHIGKPMEDIIDNIRFSTIMENIKEVINSEEIFEKEIQTDDKRWFQMNILPYIVLKDNKVNGVIITFIDITGRVNVLRELERLNASHETFIYSVSHDLKAPLANIEALVIHLKSTTLGLMEKHGSENEEQKTIMKMLDKSVNSMNKILSELSEVAKIEGNYKEIIEKVNFENILDEVKMTLNDKISESKAHILWDFKVQEVVFSKKNIRSIIFNLISNAIKYRSPDSIPEIQVKTEGENGFVVISVKDNGIGISSLHKTQIFTPFARFEKKVEGTGIGLYLVKKIVENEGGKVYLESETGKGSLFKVYLKSENAMP